MSLLDAWALDSAPTEADPDLQATAERLLDDVGGPDSGGTVVSVRGPGGTGKSALLAELGTLWSAAGLPVLDLRRVPADEPGRPVAVLVDDAHRLDAPSLTRVRRLAGDPAVRLALAYRPWPRPPELVAVTGAGNSAVLGNLSRAALQRWSLRELGVPAPPPLVEAVLRETGGVPALALPLLRAAARPAARQAAALPVRLDLPPEVSGRVRADLAALDDGGRAVLCALAVGAPLDSDLLAEALEIPGGQAGELVACARATGFLLASGEVVPVVRRILLAVAPREGVRGLRRRLLDLLLDRGERPLELARAIAREGDRNPRAGSLLAEHGTAALTSDPRLAGELLAEAAATGRPALAARRAEAAALLREFDAALSLADAALQDPTAPDSARASRVAGAVLAGRGLLGRSADLFRQAGDDAVGALALVLTASGARAEAEAVLAPPDGNWAAPSMAAAGQVLTAQGVLASLGTAGSDDVPRALSLLSQATQLLEPLGSGVLLADTPAALAGLVALHNGELGIAESVLRRALSHELGGRPARPRHLLLLAWASMLRGRLHAARALATEAAGAPLEPRDELFLRALEVGLARRHSDLPGLARAWEHAREAVLRHPIDLLSLLPLGELVVAGARLGSGGVLAPHRAAATELLGRLGGAPLWATALHWSGVQAAILSGDPAALGPHATALVTAARTNRFAAALAAAGRSWLHVLNDDIDAAAVVAAAEGLGAVGLAWDGSRLAGQAAARAADPRDRTALLSCARSLAEDDEATAPRGTATAEAAPEPIRGCQLSSREREVAELLVAGQTYREVGGKLFISAKTVEHHVARIRQRLGASNRSDLLARLRAELAQGG
jgi:DNA-binding CsgD family transcriptional regulator